MAGNKIASFFPTIPNKAPVFSHLNAGIARFSILKRTINVQEF